MKRNHLSRFITILATSLLAACASADPEAEELSTNGDALMKPITWRNSSVSTLDATTGAGSSIAVNKPAGTVAGDVEVAVVTSYHWVTVSPPSGWSLVKTQTDTGTTVAGSGVGTSVFVRVAGQSEPGSYTFKLSGKARAVATIQAYANVDTQNPIDVVVSAGETTAKTQHKTPSLSTTANGAVLLGIFGILSPKEPASATSTMAHERVDRSTGDAGSWGIGLAVYDSNPRPGPATESGRAAESSSATDTATMTLLALRSKGGVAVSTRFGSSFSPHSNERYDQIINMFGDVGVARSFDGGKGVGPFLNFQAQDMARGAASAFSFQYQPLEVLAGKHDAALKSFFQGIEDDHPVYWTYWHEPDDELYVDQKFTPSEYRAAWARIKKIADEVKASRPNLKAYATLIIMAYSMSPTIAPSRPLLGPNGMYPGDDVIDVFGVDAYNNAWDEEKDNDKLADPEKQFGKVIDFALEHDKPWAIGELGSCPVPGNAQVRPTYLREAIKYWIARKYPPVYAAYYNVDLAFCDYRLDSDAPAKQVWRDAVVNGLGAFD
jgi:hypothetical protein